MTHRHLGIALCLVSLLSAGGCDPDSGSISNGGSECEQSKEIDDGSARLNGYIEDVGSNRLVVFATVVLVTPLTEIRGESGATLKFTDLLVGMCVEVRGTFNENDEVIAERIDVETREDDR